jgi:exodeoxyribonuclease-3
VINGVTIVNTYIPQGYERESEKFQYKLEWFERLSEYFAGLFAHTEQIIWVGDFNIAREAKDVYDPDRLWGNVCYCAEVQDALAQIMEFGFVDVFRQHCDEPKQYTFWDYRGLSFPRNFGWRLDYIMATRTLADKCTRCWIDKEPRKIQKPSDHTPLLAEFQV